MDTWITGFNPPKLDETQDLQNITGGIVDGVATFDFTRKRVTNDESDYSFTDEHCLYLMFPVNGGSFHAVNKKIKKHGGIPVVTDTRVCIKSCGLASDNYVGPSTTPAPNRLAYAVSVKLTNLADGFEAPQKGTPEYDQISRTIMDNLNGVLSAIPGYHKLENIEFEK